MTTPTDSAAEIAGLEGQVAELQRQLDAADDGRAVMRIQMALASARARLKALRKARP
jgi:hypothetical protein